MPREYRDNRDPEATRSCDWTLLILVWLGCLWLLQRELIE